MLYPDTKNIKASIRECLTKYKENYLNNSLN